MIKLRAATKKRLIIGIIALTCSLLSLPIAKEHLAPIDPGLYTVQHVADGDTIVVNIDGKEEKIRFIGVDTPEKNDHRKPVQCYAQAASDFTTAQLQGSKVRLQADAQSDNRDRYGRLLRYVYLPDGTLLNEQIIRQGFGFAITGFPHSKMEQFTAAQRSAEQQKTGLWGRCTVSQPSGYPQTQAVQAN